MKLEVVKVKCINYIRVVLLIFTQVLRQEAFFHKKISEGVLRDIAIEMSDVIVLVVNELSRNDQVVLSKFR